MNLINKTIDEILNNISDVKIFESEDKKDKRKIKFENDDKEQLIKNGFIVSELFFDSRKVSKKTDAFFATKGVNVDRVDFIDEVIKKGSRNIFCSELPKKIFKIVSENKKWPKKYKDVTFIVVKNLEEKVGEIAENFYGNPSKKIKIIGITGTNGKTTIAFSIFDILKKMNQKVAILSTIKNIIGSEVQESINTTPDPITISKNLRKAVDNKCNYLVMEVSSHSLEQNRVKAVDFDAAIFTNLTQDHLDYHENMNNYFLAKKKLFDNLKKDAIAVSNYDDNKGIDVLIDTSAKKFSYSFFDKNFFKKYDTEFIQNSYFFKKYTIKDGKTEVVFSDKKTERKINLNLLGEFNIYNMLSVYAVLSEIGFDKNLILKKIEEVEAPKGRMEVVAKNNSKNVLAIVDYAHTPDALENILQTLHEIREDGIRIITVVGAGGDRDKAKRPLMGKIAVVNSDFVFFTSDNPRSEKPLEILNDMVGKLKETNLKVIENRSSAIVKAVEFCNNNDILVVAGKGHEEYQIIGKDKKFFSDRKELEKILK